MFYFLIKRWFPKLHCRVCFLVSAIGITGEVLRIPGTPRGSTGVYLCKGENGVFHDDYVIQLTVKCK